MQHVLQIQAVYCLRDYVTETATQLFCLKLAKYRISNIWIIFVISSIQSLLRNSLSKLPKTACSDGS